MLVIVLVNGTICQNLEVLGEEDLLLVLLVLVLTLNTVEVGVQVLVLLVGVKTVDTEIVQEIK